MNTWIWQVPSEYIGNERADRIILQNLPQERFCTRNQLQRLIEKGFVTLNGKPLKSSSKLKPGDQVKVEFQQPSRINAEPENIPLEILYEDKHIIIINKPQGLTVHPSLTQKNQTLVNALLYHVKDLSGLGGALRPGIVHRLDKNTSGALVVSKTDEAHQNLVKTFSKHEIERRYWALCYGSPDLTGELKIETLIGRSTTDRKKMSSKAKTGRRAVTYIKKLEEYSIKGRKPFACLIEARLETGRTHQVRVHLTDLGHSIFGDPTYGKPSAKQTKWVALPDEVKKLVEQLPGQALHARVLGFKHPVLPTTLCINSNPPGTFNNLLKILRSFS